MPKKSEKTGKLGDIIRALGREEAARRLGWSVSTMDKWYRMPHRRPDDYHDRILALHREVCP